MAASPPNNDSDKPTTSAAAAGGGGVRQRAGPSGSHTRTEVLPANTQPEAPTLRLTLNATPTQAARRVSWNADTVDNEHLNRKKSKCCCIYKKPRQFGESSSESDDDECENCFGHVEKKKRNRKGPPAGDPHPHDEKDEHDHGHDHDHDGPPPPTPATPAAN